MAEAPLRRLRSGRAVLTATPPRRRKGGRLTSGSPSAPPSQGQASVADELTSGFPNAPLSPGQANFGSVVRTSRWPVASPGQAQKAMRVRAGEKDRLMTEVSVAQSSLVAEAGTTVMQRRPLRARQSDGEDRLTTEVSVPQSSLVAEAGTEVMQRRPVRARQSDGEDLLTTEVAVAQSSLVVAEAGTPVMPQQPVLAWQSDVSQEESAAPILDELRRISALITAS